MFYTSLTIPGDIKIFPIGLLPNTMQVDADFQTRRPITLEYCLTTHTHTQIKLITFDLWQNISV